MFEGLRRKWGVGGWQLLFILCTFAIGGSLSGRAAHKLLSLTAIGHGAGWVALYILLVTVLWPLCVLLVSIPLGQFGFFRRYLARLGRRLSGRETNRPPSRPDTGRDPVGKKSGTVEEMDRG
jgi:hypothetical protein